MLLDIEKSGEQDNILKGGYLDFSHLSKLKNEYITEIYMKKQNKSSIIKNHKITNKKNFDGVPLTGYIASDVIFRFCAKNKKMHCGNIQ